MGRIGAIPVLACSVSVLCAAGDRTLDLAERIAAQTSIERVAYAYQIGARLPFEVAVTRGRIEYEVRDSLKKSLALETYWGVEVTAAALDREIERIVARTRLPDRLERVFQALGHDPFVIRECLARPALVDRLAPRLYAQDPRMPAGVSFEEWWGATRSGLDERRVVAVASAAALPPIRGGTPRGGTDEGVCSGWDGASLRQVPQAAAGHVAVWTGSLMLVHGGSLGEEGMRYDPLIDSWTPMATTGSPFAGIAVTPFETERERTAVWTGTEMIVWGNTTGDTTSPRGGRYDPLADTWTPVSTVAAPIPRRYHTAVWTGTKMLIWGGQAMNATRMPRGAIYDPASNTWQAIPVAGQPTWRWHHGAVWTGTHMLVWGGTSGSTLLGDGGRYDPFTNAWSSLPPGGPSPRVAFSTVWTGEEMVVWGGSAGLFNLLADGGRYDPAANTWIPMASAPDALDGHSAVWTGEEMIAWGTQMCGGVCDKHIKGLRYAPDTDTWSPVTSVGAPSLRLSFTTVWTGQEMIVWGGNWGDPQHTGARYDPDRDLWTATSTGDAAPAARSGQATVWTGNEMIVWGGKKKGSPSGGLTDRGGRYDPLLDAWSALPAAGAPVEVPAPRAVWSGEEMLVFGGPASSGRYDPLADAWSPMSLSGAPGPPIEGATAVWTGDEMVVWGGGTESNGSNCQVQTGGSAYDPSADSWSALPAQSAPGLRMGHTAVWTGQEMIVWGGLRKHFDPTIPPAGLCVLETLEDGAGYDPGTGQWTALWPTGAPAKRFRHTAIWTGEEVIVWGGQQGDPGPLLGDGARYDPESAQWMPLETTGAPAARTGHTAEWTGQEMIVWGGDSASAEGGRYDPLLDAWTATETPGGPAGRTGHTAIWTGNEMVVWGGIRWGFARSDGGRYRTSFAPGEVGGLAAERPDPGTIRLRWTIAPDADSYQVLRGDVGQIGSGQYGACLAQGVAGPTFDDPELPAAEAGFTYLVRAERGCGAGDLGQDSSGVPRVPVVDPCE